jgi:hypothetical protein
MKYYGIPVQILNLVGKQQEQSMATVEKELEENLIISVDSRSAYIVTSAKLTTNYV